MNITKANIWVIGLCLIFAGGMLTYLESYKNNEVISIISYLLFFGGWLCIFMKATKGTIVDAPKIFYKTDKTGYFKQRIISFFAHTISICVIIGLMFWLSDLGEKRKTDILEHQPTKTAIAVVDHIDERQGRSTTSYYAVFQYTVNGELISHPWHVNYERDFLVGERFNIKYSIAHPDMFMLLDKLP